MAAPAGTIEGRPERSFSGSHEDDAASRDDLWDLIASVDRGNEAPPTPRHTYRRVPVPDAVLGLPQLLQERFSHTTPELARVWVTIVSGTWSFTIVG